MSRERGELFRTVCEMEDEVSDCEGLIHAIVLMAPAITGRPASCTIYTVASLALDKIEKIESARGRLFDLTHPTRAESDAA